MCRLIFTFKILLLSVNLCSACSGAPICSYEDSQIRQLMLGKDCVSELTIRLFPSPFESIDVNSISSKNLAQRLDALSEESARVKTVIAMFDFCCQIRSSAVLLDEIMKIKSYTEPVNEVLKKLNFAKKRACKRGDLIDLYDYEVNACKTFFDVIKRYDTSGFDSIFVLMARSIKFEEKKYTTEGVLLTFCLHYFEKGSYESVINGCAKMFNICNKYDYTFPYKVGTPFIEHDSVVVNGVEFPDCIETAVRHFFNLVQPTNPEELVEYWKYTGSPITNEVTQFFVNIQGSRRTNDGRNDIRTAWAKILSNLPIEQVQLSYKQSPDSGSINTVELKAGWSNFIKAIAYLKNDVNILQQMYDFDMKSSKNMDLQTALMCNSLYVLSDGKLFNIEWHHDDSIDGIRDMENGLFDILGTIRCSVSGINRKIEFVMRNGHGLVRWVKS